MFNDPQPVQARPVAAVTTPATTIGTNTGAPYRRVISESDYEYESDEDGVCECDDHASW